MRPIMITGGATGGHVLPALSVALALRDAGHDIVFVGGSGELEERMCRAYGVPFRAVRHALGPGRREALTPSPLSLRDCQVAIKRFRPRALFSKGSAISIPVVAVARGFGVPVVLHESDVVPGAESRMLAPLCQAVCVGHPDAEAGLRQAVIYTGNPVRPAFADGEPDRCRRALGLPHDRPLIFVTGGSQGARALNELVWPIVHPLCERWSIVHQVGPGKLDGMGRDHAYVAVECFDREIRDVYAAADLLVSRAGATTIAEAAVYRVPAIFIPYPWSADNHQRANALLAGRRGVATVWRQSALTPARLLEVIEEGMARREQRRARYGVPAHEEALARIVDVITKAASSGRRC